MIRGHEPGSPARRDLGTDLRQVRIIIGMRLRRFGNQLAAGQRILRRRPQEGPRTGTPGKRRGGVLWGGLIYGAILLGTGSSAAAALRILSARFEDPASLTGALACEASLLTIASFFASLGTRELVVVDGDLEWLVTLPVRLPVLLWGRVLERSVTNLTGLLFLLPYLFLLAWQGGWRWCAPLLAVLGAAQLFALMAVARTMVDTGLRLRLRPAQLRNVGAAISVLAMLSLYLAFSASTRNNGLVVWMAGQWPAWANFTPPGLVVQALGAPSLPRSLGLMVLGLAEVGLVLLAGIRLVSHLLRHGVVGEGLRESERRAPAGGHGLAGAAAGGAAAGGALAQAGAGMGATVPAHRAPVAPVRSSGLVAGLSSRLSAVQVRELRLLGRDRNFLVQTLVLPVLVVASQAFLNGTLQSPVALWDTPAVAATTAFGLAAYTLMLSAFQTLHAEGGALWMLYTFPSPISSVLAQKARLWAVLALLYPCAIFLAGAGHALRDPLDYLRLAAQVLVGVPIFAAIAVALGVRSANPTATDAATRTRPTHLYLFMAIAGLYAFGIRSDDPVQSIVVMVLAALLALALWQQAMELLPFLLDPTMAPPPRVSTADGMVSILFFFLLQAFVHYVLRTHAGADRPWMIPWAYGLAAVLVYLVVRLLYWRRKVTQVPAMLGEGVRPWLAAMAAALAVAISGGLAWEQVLARIATPAPPDPASGLTGLALPWLLVLVSVFAPLCEEFLFRGLLFGGLRRSLSFAPAALASAGVFAIVHPPAAWPAVFLLGICTAWTYERSRSLLAPMLVHGLYNAVMVWGAL